MKRAISIFMVIIMLSFTMLTLGASAYDISSKPTKILDLDENSNLKARNVINDISKVNTKNADDIDLVNLSMENYTKEEKDVALNLVDKGALLVIQDDNYFKSNDEVATFFGLNEQQIAISETKGNAVTIGYTISKDDGEYVVNPVLASLMIPVDTDMQQFDMEKELQELKESDDIYIDPTDIYSHHIESKQDKFYTNEDSSPRKALGTSYSFFSHQYLYGKNGNAVWGIKDGYTEFGYIEMYTTITRKHITSTHNHDSVETRYVMTGRNNKYVKKYIVAQVSKDSPSFMEDWARIKCTTNKDISFSYSVNSKGELTVSYTITQTDFNPAAQAIDYAKTDNKVAWTVEPNSHRSNQTWEFEGSSTIRTPIGKDSFMWIGVDELIVDNSLLQYKSPGPCATKITIKK